MQVLEPSPTAVWCYLNLGFDFVSSRRPVLACYLYPSMTCLAVAVFVHGTKYLVTSCVFFVTYFRVSTGSVTLIARAWLEPAGPIEPIAASTMT